MLKYSSVHSYLKSIFPNEEIRHYVVKTIADAIHSDQPTQKLFVFKGLAASGKSRFINFLKNVYGSTKIDYVSQCILEKPINNYIFDGLNEKRIAIIQDSDINKKIDANVLKTILNNNILSIYGRKVNFPGILIMCCNTVPEIDGNDFDTNQFDIINFESKFNSTNQILDLDNLIEEFRDYIQHIYNFRNIIENKTSLHYATGDNVTYLTANKLIDLLSKIPSNTKVALYNDPECFGDYYIHSIDYKPHENRVILSCAGCQNANTCDNVDETGQWWNCMDD